MLISNNDKTPYEIWKGRPTYVNHSGEFGSKCYIKRENGNIGKFYSRVDKGIFFRYSSKIKEYKCLNLRLNRIMESINVHIDEIVYESPKKKAKTQQSMKKKRI